MLLPNDLKHLDGIQRLRLHKSLMKCAGRKFMQRKRKKYYLQAAQANIRALQYAFGSERAVNYYNGLMKDLEFRIAHI